MNKKEYKNLLKKVEYLAKNRQGYPGVEKIVSLWNKIKANNVIFIFDKETVEEIDRLYNESAEETSIISFDFDDEVSATEQLNWIKENFEHISDLISSQLSVNIDTGKKILSEIISGNNLKKLKIKEQDKRSLFRTDDTSIANETGLTDQLLKQILSIVESYNNVIKVISSICKKKRSLSNYFYILQDNNDQNNTIILKIPFDDNLQVKNLSEILIEQFGSYNSFELFLGYDFLTIFIKNNN